MTASQSLNSGDPIIPEGRIEWRDNIQFAVVIAICFLAGHALARALRAIGPENPGGRKRRSQHPEQMRQPQ